MTASNTAELHGITPLFCKTQITIRPQQRDNVDDAGSSTFNLNISCEDDDENLPSIDKTCVQEPIIPSNVLSAENLSDDEGVEVQCNADKLELRPPANSDVATPHATTLINLGERFRSLMRRKSSAPMEYVARRRSTDFLQTVDTHDSNVTQDAHDRQTLRALRRAGKSLETRCDFDNLSSKEVGMQPESSKWKYIKKSSNALGVFSRKGIDVRKLSIGHGPTASTSTSSELLSEPGSSARLRANSEDVGKGRSALYQIR